MLLDLIGAIALTGAAAIVIGLLVNALPWTRTARAWAAGTLSLWFVIVATLGASGVLDATSGFGPAGVGIVAALPIALIVAAALHRRMLAPAITAIPVQLLVGVNAVRVLGVFFVLLYAAQRLPAPFAPTAGWGDVIVGCTALPVAWLVAARARSWRSVALLWNAFGLMDLAVAVFLGVTSAPGTPLRLFFDEPDTAIMGGLPWLLVPGFLAPLLALTHLAVFRRLFSAPPATAPLRADATRGVPQS